jgi:hypothetical protein
MEMEVLKILVAYDAAHDKESAIEALVVVMAKHRACKFDAQGLSRARRAV